MLNLNIAAMRVPSLRLMLRAQHNIDSILLEQTVEKKDGDGDGGGGCGDGGCRIFWLLNFLLWVFIAREGFSLGWG